MRWLIAAMLLGTSSAHAVDGVSLVYGQGNSVDVFAVQARSGAWRRWALGEAWRLSAYTVASVANWRAREETEHRELWDLGIAPVFRLERARTLPYLEASLGAHLLSRRQINGNREFSTAFQFGEFVGAGVAFGARHELDLALRLQHVSNGGIKNPNPGLTFVSLALGYRF